MIMVVMMQEYQIHPIDTLINRKEGQVFIPRHLCVATMLGLMTAPQDSNIIRPLKLEV
jgi:hypothetical protein